MNESSKNWATQLTNPPAVSCICPTYGRVELLEESIHSFLLQDYPGPKELIILNDYAQQALIIDHPEVQVINETSPFHSVGDKYNAAVAHAAHDLIFVWHDDDIYLPHRLSYSVCHFDWETPFFKPTQAWFWNDGQLSGPEQNVFHGGCCWPRTVHHHLDGYASINLGYDISFEERWSKRWGATPPLYSIQADEIFYIYRWAGTGSYHLSSHHEQGNELNQVTAYVEEQAQRGQIRQGEIRLTPHWQTDYCELVQAYLKGDWAKRADEERQQKEECPDAPPVSSLPDADQPGEQLSYDAPHYQSPPYYVITPPPLRQEQKTALFQSSHPLKISVILPAVNESHLLQRTVEQFEATLPEESEIIVVDNGSADGCADFLVGTQCPNIHLIRTPDALGVSGARNRGLAQAKGEVVVFCDAHMDLPERWWQPMVAALNQPNVGMVGPGIGIMGEPESPISYGQRIAESSLRQEWLDKQQDRPYPVPVLGGGFMAMRHETLKCAGAFDIGMPQWGAEDLEISVRYWLLGYQVWVVPSVTVLHNFRETSPYTVQMSSVTHNVLRVALLYFSQPRLTRILDALKERAEFAEALAFAVESGVWQQRAKFQERTVRDDAWFLNRFQDTCKV